MKALRVLIGASLALAAVLLGVALATAEHGQMLGAGCFAMAACSAAFVAGVLVGDLP